MKHLVKLAPLFLTALACNAQVINHSDSLRDYSKDLRDESIDDTGTMQNATLQNRADFATMVNHVMNGNLLAADGVGSTLGYRVVNFTDSDSGKSYYHLREGAIGVSATKGWGSYFFNPNSTRNVMVQAPHIRHDTHSYDVASVAFTNSDALALMFNGAHRDAGGNNVADVAHLSNSIYQTVHESWTTDNTVQAWQIHGFSLESTNSQGDFIHEDIPAGTDVVLSNGNGLVSDEIKNLDAVFEGVSFINDAQSISHAYNTLLVNDPDNVLVNGMVDGTNMSTLGGTTNDQGIYTRAQGGTFVHIELEQSIRLDGTLQEDLDNRETAGLAIASAIQMTTPVPEPSTSALIFLGMVVSLRRRARVG